MISYEMQKWILKESKKRKGWIYLMKHTDPDIFSMDHQGNKSPVYTWKYGKTKYLNKRMAFYSKDYELIEAWRVNHLSLRENFIHDDWYIQQSRDESFRSSRDEHVDWDCYDIVKHYATGEVQIVNDSEDHRYPSYMVSIGNDRTERDLHSATLKLIRVL